MITRVLLAALAALAMMLQGCASAAKTCACKCVGCDCEVVE